MMDKRLGKLRLNVIRNFCGKYIASIGHPLITAQGNAPEKPLLYLSAV